MDFLLIFHSLDFPLKGPQTELQTLSQNCEQTLQKLRANRNMNKGAFPNFAAAGIRVQHDKHVMLVLFCIPIENCHALADQEQVLLGPDAVYAC